MTTQVSWRADEELIARAKRRARALGKSLNAYLTLVDDTATNPEAAGTEAEQLRERLEAAGLLAHFPPPGEPLPTPEEMTEAMDALRESERDGPTLAELLSEGRGE